MIKKIFFVFLCASFINGYSQSISLITPVDNYYNPGFKVTFSWNTVFNITSYRIRIANDINFTSIVKDTITNNSSLTVNFNSNLSRVFWRISTANTSTYVQSPISTLNFISPSQSPNIIFWLAADSNVVIQPDSTVSSWTTINNGNVASQPTPGSRPRLMNNTLELNNKPVVYFKGGTDELISNVGGGPVANTYALCNYTGGSFPGAYVGLLTNNVIPPPTADYLIEGAPGTSMYTGYYGGSYFMNNIFQTNFSPLNKYKVVSGQNPPILNQKSYSGFFVGKDPAGASWLGNVAEIIVSKLIGTAPSPGEADSIHTYLYNKYAPPVSLGPDIVLGSSFSDSAVLNAGTRFVSYLWSNGGIASTTKVATAGTYSVKATDVFGNQSSDEVQVYPYKRLNNTKVFLCAGDSLVLNLGISNPQFTFLWSTGNNTTNKITIKSTGQYTVTITDSKGQTINDTINVFIGTPALSPALPPSNNLKLCYNEKLFVTTEAEFDSIRWSTGSTSPFIQITDSGNYTIYARTINGCIINKAFHVSIAGFAPIADFVTSSVCQNAATTFIDSSSTPPNNSIVYWKWTFGNGDTASTQIANNVYTGLGNYIASLKIVTNVGCTDSIAKIITVNKKPSPSFAILLACAGNPTTFQDQTTANSASVINWVWDFGGLGTITGIQNPSFRFPSPGQYDVKLIATNSNGCIDSIVSPATVYPSPISDFTADSVCGATPVSFKFLARAIPPSTLTNNHSWDFGDGTGETTIFNAQHKYAVPGVYDVQLVVQSSDGCMDTVQKSIRVFDFPVVDFTVSQTQCTGKDIQFTDISYTPDSTPINKWHWFFSGQATDTIQNPKYVFNAEGNYTIQLTASNTVGCTGTKLRSIAVSAPPSPKFTFTPQNGLPPLNVSYFNQSSTSGNYIWDYGDGSVTFTGYNPPSHTYTVKGTYPIKLTATDFRGCSDSLVKYILVDKAYLDGVLATISIIPDGAFYQVRITILNNSNVEIRSLGLSLQLTGGTTIRENWTGSLLPGRSVDYLFNGEVKLNSNQIPVICATIDNVNDNSPEDRTDNNSSCKELSVGSFDVLTVYPNPAYENINFGVMLPQDGRVHIGLIDYLGQEMYSVDYDGIRGYNNLTMPTMELNSAVYIAEITFNGETIRKKFMRKDLKK